MTTERDYIIGEIKATFFENPNNYYRVMKIRVDETNTMYSEDEIVVTGVFAEIQEGTTYQFKGQLVDHPKYGIQFKCETYERQKITSREGLQRFLSSDQFPGIGKTLAKRIVTQFGEETIDIILNSPDRLQEIKGLTKKKRVMLHDLLESQQGNEQVFIQLAEMGFSNQLAAKIHAQYHNDAIEIIEENPYALIEDINGFGFKRADELAMHLEFPPDSQVRITGAIIYKLDEICMQSGNTYVEYDGLADQVSELLSEGQVQRIEPDLVKTILDEMSELGKIIITEGHKVALPSLYYAEAGIAAKLNHMQQDRYQPEYPNCNLDDEIGTLEEELNIRYGNAQKAAIREALMNKVFVLTGGPGTGKTTVLNGIVQLYSKLNDLSLDADDYEPGGFPIALAAPTGRAAKRMSEMISLPASTIHRLLGLTGEEDETEEWGGNGQQLEADLLIIDEMSMVDTWLANQLLERIPPFMQVIFVGDKDQLPSVGPGQVLSDIIRSQTVKTRELDEIYRQDDESTIVTLAHNIKQGIVPGNLTINQSDRSFMVSDTNHLAPLVSAIAKRAIEKGYDKRSVQVLAPMYRGRAGIHALNEQLQFALNPNNEGTKREVSYFEQTFRVGDKVLQLKNQPEDNVFNGDVGEIVAIFRANETESKVDEIVVAFDDVEVTYERKDWNQITLAYCTSIHKSQGSEFPIVILPLVKQFQRMLQRNLIYTAITRAKQSLVLIGDPDAFVMAIQNVTEHRDTQLFEFLLEANHLDSDEVFVGNDETSVIDKEIEEDDGPKILTAAHIINQQIDPMIGMEGLTPYDF